MRKISLAFIILFSISCNQSSFDAASLTDSTKLDDGNEKQYIVVFGGNSVQQAKGAESRNKASQELSKLMEKQYSVKTLRRFSQAIVGAVYKMNSKTIAEMSKDENIQYIEEDRVVSVNSSQNSPPWGLDRIDQSSLPLNNNYTTSNEGQGVNVYVLDTGVLNTHRSFENRAQHGRDSVDNDDDSTDCHGHGTHVAGTIGSKDYGVAKKSNIIGLRVMNCRGSGRLSSIIGGIEWVTLNHKKPAVANMSLGSGPSSALDQAVKSSIGAGITYVIAAGNSNDDACFYSPARIPQAITVGSSTRSDEASSFSNYGSCVDIFAPGIDIISTWHTSNTSTQTISGTSMAAPHVAGVAALYLSKNPNASPRQVAQALTENASKNKLQFIEDSPNLLLNTNFLDSAPINRPNPGTQPKVTVHKNLKAQTNRELRYSVVVPKGSSEINVTASGNNGDADLYVRFDNQPTTNDFDCRPFNDDSNEACAFNRITGPRTVHIMLRAYEEFSHLELKITIK